MGRNDGVALVPNDVGACVACNGPVFAPFAVGAIVGAIVAATGGLDVADGGAVAGTIAEVGDGVECVGSLIPRFDGANVGDFVVVKGFFVMPCDVLSGEGAGVYDAPRADAELVLSLAFLATVTKTVTKAPINMRHNRANKRRSLRRRRCRSCMYFGSMIPGGGR